MQAGRTSSGFRLSNRSRYRLEGVHPDLRQVVERAIQITTVDFVVIEGKRSKERQIELYRTGKSKTMRSRHLTGHAVDLAAWVNGTISWEWPHYREIARAMKQVAQELNIPIEWGGDWVTFKDGPHFQLPWEQYPA